MFMTFKELEILRGIGEKAKDFCYCVDFEFGDESAIIFSYPKEKSKDMIHYIATDVFAAMGEELKGIHFRFAGEEVFKCILHCEQCLVYFKFENFDF